MEKVVNIVRNDQSEQKKWNLRKQKRVQFWSGCLLEMDTW